MRANPSVLEVQINRQTVQVCFDGKSSEPCERDVRALKRLDHVLRANPSFQKLHPQVRLEQVFCASLPLAQMGRFRLTYRDASGVFVLLACLGANTMIDLLTQQVVLSWGAV